MKVHIIQQWLMQMIVFLYWFMMNWLWLEKPCHYDIICIQPTGKWFCQMLRVISIDQREILPSFCMIQTIWNNAVTLIYIIDVSISSPQCHGFEIYLYVWTFHRQQSLDIAKDTERPILAHISQLIQIIQWLRVNLDLIVE